MSESPFAKLGELLGKVPASPPAPQNQEKNKQNAREVARRQHAFARATKLARIEAAAEARIASLVSEKEYWKKIRAAESAARQAEEDAAKEEALKAKREADRKATEVYHASLPCREEVLATMMQLDAFAQRYSVTYFYDGQVIEFWAHYMTKAPRPGFSTRRGDTLQPLPGFPGWLAARVEIMTETHWVSLRYMEAEAEERARVRRAQLEAVRRWQLESRGSDLGDWLEP